MEDLVNAVVVCQFLFYERASRTFCVPTFAYLLLVPVHQAIMLRMDSNGYPYEIFKLYGFPSESELPASPSLRNGSRHPHFWGWHFEVSGSVPLELLFLKGCPGIRKTPTLRTAHLLRRKVGLFGTKIRKSENSHGHPFESILRIRA
jgi:hypothetical protein